MDNDKYTQAFNFVSALQGGVDPRTGLFSTSMKLASLTANAGMGPGLDIALSYSPVQSENRFSLGTGMSLGMSTFDDKNQTLQLSTGESYRTYTTPHGKVTPRQQNIENFKLNKHDADYLLHHKSGVSERLTLCHDNTFVSSLLESPLGHRMKLLWRNQDGLRLEKVLDGDGKVLCALDYVGERITVSLFRPDSKREKPLIITLTTENDYLKKVTLGKMNWSLHYDPAVTIGGKQLLQRITFPTGGEEEVRYHQHPGHVYPVVSQHTFHSGSGFPPQTLRYQYSENNFMGSNLPVRSTGDNADGLYEYEGSYLYWSQETHEHIDSVTKQAKPTVITRTYNNFHLMISEETTCGSAAHLTETEYNIKHRLPFARQSSTLQFPRAIRQTWRKGSKGSRTEITHHQYDDKGNLTRSVSPNGTVTVLSYYPPAGEDVACPASPQGLTSLLKSKTVFHPISKRWGDECAVRTLYTYQKLNIPPQRHNAYAVIKDKEITYIGYANKKVKETFNRDPYAFNWDEYDAVMTTSHASVVISDAKNVHFGRVMKNQSTLHAAGGLTYTSEQTHEYTYLDGILSVTSHARSHDGLVLTDRADVSVYTGNTFKKTDALGDEVQYVFDPVGRVKSVVFNAGSPDRTLSQHYAYHLPDPATGASAMTVLTDVRGNKFRISYDGLGRETRHELMNPDCHADTIDGLPSTGHEGDWFTVKTAAWDDMGRKVSETRQDYLPKGSKQAPQAVTFTTTQMWDDWGAASATTGSDGITHHAETDPVAMVSSTWLSGENSTLTGRVRGYSDPRTHLPVKKEILTPEGTTYSVTSQTHDEMGRLRTATDENACTTAWDYDAMGRVVKTTYPDGSIIVKEYAPFSVSDHVTRLTLMTAQGKEFMLGTQRWDGMGRLIETVSGGRKTTFYYQHAWQHKPASQIGPDGVEVQLSQDVQLGGAVTGVKAGEISHSYNYDKKLRHMTNAEVLKAGTSQQWALYPSGRLRTETSAVRGGAPLATQWNYSLCGHPVRITANGWQQTCTYSALGRLEKIQDNAINVTLTYDDLGRIERWVAEERLTKAWLKTTRVLDPYGRETSRHLHHSNGLQRIISQTWLRNNLVSERASCDEKKHDRLREFFQYDNRNRLIKYTCEGTDLPTDPYGNLFNGQEFIFDALNNITVCKTHLAAGGVNEARYFFSDKDPCQLTGVTNGEPGREKESAVDKGNTEKTALGYPRMIHLEYDAAGRMTLDTEGRTLKYDALGRLSGITGGSYDYDASNRLVYQKIDKNSMAHRLYYRAEQLVNEWITEGEGAAPDATKDKQLRLIYAAGGCVAQESQHNGQVMTMLLGTNSKNSVVAEIEKDEVRENVYTPYGYVKPKT